MDENLAAYYQPPVPPPPTVAHYPAYYQATPPAIPSLAPLPLPPHHHPYIPQQPLAAAPAGFASYGAQDQVRTLFVAGLPEDVKAREIYNLFREFPGYESSNLPICFCYVYGPDICGCCTPRTQCESYMKNCGLVFDLEKGSTLHIDLAKSNSRSKRSRTAPLLNCVHVLCFIFPGLDDERSGSDKKARGSLGFSVAAAELGFGSIHLPGIGNSAYNTIGYPPAQSHGNSDGRAVKDSATAKLSNSSAPPCPTLFVANLGPNCTEQELIQVFSSDLYCKFMFWSFGVMFCWSISPARCPGFLKLKIQSTYGAPVPDCCLHMEHFVLVYFFLNPFTISGIGMSMTLVVQDTACSTGALNHLQGTVLYSSPAGEGMRLEYPLDLHLCGTFVIVVLFTTDIIIVVVFVIAVIVTFEFLSISP
uniref:RRM domain-containing protein n=1 Tax=Turnera subulata TaxID=218843 RepID=A0A516IJG3_9ROSI